MIGWIVASFLFVLCGGLCYLLRRASRIIENQDEQLGTVRVAAESYHAGLERLIGNEVMMDSPEVMTFHRTAKSFLNLLQTTAAPEPHRAEKGA